MTAEEPAWVDLTAVLLAHEIIVAETGGHGGIRDVGLLESALERPVNRWRYEGEDEISRLAAIYGVAVAKNHPFIDGNKRSAFMCLNIFLEANGRRLTASEDDATETMLAVAAGEIGEDGLADWIVVNSEST